MNSKELEKTIELFTRQLQKLKKTSGRQDDIEMYKVAIESLRKVWASTLLVDGVKSIRPKKGPGMSSWEVIEKNGRKRSL